MFYVEGSILGDGCSPESKQDKYQGIKEFLKEKMSNYGINNTT